MADDAIYDARSICMREYGDAPEVSVYGDPRFTFAYVPSHLHHMVRTACGPPSALRHSFHPPRVFFVVPLNVTKACIPDAAPFHAGTAWRNVSRCSSW